MIRSILSGVSGMRAHQVRMDVIGDNIANVNTTGYKASRTSFQTTLSQTLKAGGGGRNPAQVGTGMSLSGIYANFEQGALQSTGRALDIAIEGNGFFKLQDPNSGEYYFTRDGSFFIDTNGYIVNASGLRLCDDTGTGVLQIQMIDPGTGNNLTIEYIQIADNGEVTGQVVDTGTGNASPLTFATGSGTIGLANFPNPNGLLKAGQTLYRYNSIAGTEVNGAPKSNGLGTLNSGYLEMSNVDLTDEFATMITTQRGYQANARVITVSDTLLEELIQLKR